MEKAQQTEKVIVIEEGQGFSDTNIFEEGKKATATTDVSEKDYFAIVATGITMSSKTASENNSPSQLVPTNETVVDEHLTTGAPTTAVQNQPSVPTVTTNVHIADAVMESEIGSGGNTVPGSEDVDGSSVVLPTSVAGHIFGSVRALGTMFGVVSPKKPPTPGHLVATAGPDSQENETLGSTDTLVADLISGIQTIAADGKVELLKKLLNDLKSSTGSM